MEFEGNIHTALFSLGGAQSSWQVAAEIDSNPFPPYQAGPFPGWEEWKKSLRHRPEDRLFDGGVAESDARFGADLIRYICSDEIKSILNYLFGLPNQATILLEVKTIDPFLSSLPWEVCIHADWESIGMNRPQAKLVFIRTPNLLRNIDLLIREPVRILFAGSNPVDNPAPNFVLENEHMQKGLVKGFRGASINRYELYESHSLTLSNLGSEINRIQPNIVHYVAHGGRAFIETQNADDEAVEAYGRDIADALVNGRDLCLFVTTACLSMQGDHVLGNPGIGRYIIEQVPYAIGMQLRISDKGALDFTRELYHALAEPRTVLGAYIYARDSLIKSRKGYSDWIAPVLYQGVLQKAKIFSQLTIADFVGNIEIDLYNLIIAARADRKNAAIWEQTLILINQVSELLIDPHNRQELNLTISQARLLEEISGYIGEIWGAANDNYDLLTEGRLQERMTFEFSEKCKFALTNMNSLLAKLRMLRESFYR